MVVESQINQKDRNNAKKCLECPVCKHARKKQKGIAFWFVKTVENSLCPHCKAYERVYSRKAHEPMPQAKTDQAEPS